MKRLRSTSGIKDAYSRRILSNIIGLDAMEIIMSTPAKLRQLTRGLTRRQVFARGPDGAWPMAYILCHLCDAEWAVGFRLRMVVAQPGRRLQAYDQDTWAERLSYDKADWRESLELFSALRRSHVTLLRRLTPAEWRQFGMHEERGKETIERMVGMLAGHDVNHLRQLKALRASLVRKRA